MSNKRVVRHDPFNGYEQVLGSVKKQHTKGKKIKDILRDLERNYSFSAEDLQAYVSVGLLIKEGDVIMVSPRGERIIEALKNI